MAKYVIIGASAGGIGAVEAIRDVDPTGSIIVISEEPAYSRPMISNLLENSVTRSKMQYRDPSFWNKHHIQRFINKHALHLDVADGYVELEDMERITFERLLLATGGLPIIPPIKGINKNGVFTFNSLSDVEALSPRIKEGVPIVVLGGGLIGVSVAEALHHRGASVTIVELKDHLLNLILDDTASNMIEDAITQAGVRVITGETIRRIIGRPTHPSEIGEVILTNNLRLPCEALVIAIGVTPRTALVENTPVQTNRGIMVNKHMQTSIPNVYACGDVAETLDFITDTNRLLPLWPLAYQQGRIAGYNMAGHTVTYPGGTNMTALKYFDVPIISIGYATGNTMLSDEILVNYDSSRRIYKKLIVRENRIIGLTFVNAIERAGLYLHLMKHRLDVKGYKDQLTSQDFGLAILPPTVRHDLLVGK
jgi:NAD(P)H-nitrite reductase large subunit